MAPVVIVGAGLAGWTTARELRKLDPATPVLLITADSGDFYAKPTLSNAFAQQRSPAALVSTPGAKMAETLNITLRPHTRVTAIDPVAQTVTTRAGLQPFRDLVLATGAQPIRVPVAGEAAGQVLSVNSLDDFSVFHARVAGTDSSQNNSKHILVMGAGLIGCEFANDLVGSGFRVSVVAPVDRPLAALLPPPASSLLREALAGLGVAWHLGTTVQAVNPGPAGAPAALVVTLADGSSVHADTVLSAIGLRADTALAQAAGLACERGIVVDAALQTSAAHVWALGDGAQYAAAGSRTWPGQTAQGLTLPFVMPLMNAARAMAATLAGQRTELVFPLMPVAVKTPALPLVVAPPAPGVAGEWIGPEPGIWQFMGTDGRQHGFVLAGGQTARRMEQAKRVAA